MSTVLNLSELQKHPGWIETLLGKLAKGAWLETATKNAACDQLYVYNKSGVPTIYSPKIKRDFKEAARLMHAASASDSRCFAVAKKGSNKPAIPISDLRSTGDFGSGSHIYLAREIGSTKILEKALKDAIIENHGPITIVTNKGRIPNVVGIRATEKSEVKSDVEFIDTNGDAVIWVSLKHGKTPLQFHQWGGISLRKEPKLFKHPETWRFLRDLYKAKGTTGLAPGENLWRRIQDRNLKMMAVYGSEFSTGRLGERNVTVILQGTPCITRCGTNWCLDATIRHYNGESVDSNGYEPVFMAYYGGAGRNEGGIPTTRIGIWPKEGRKTTAENEFKPTAK